MKILNLQDFLKMPSGTVFRKFEPCIYDGICIKKHSINTIDFCYVGTDFVDGDGQYVNLETGEFKMEYIVGRDGCFDEDQLFAVYDKSDLVELIEVLQESLNIYE